MLDAASVGVEQLGPHHTHAGVLSQLNHALQPAGLDGFYVVIAQKVVAVLVRQLSNGPVVDR